MCPLSLAWIAVEQTLELPEICDDLILRWLLSNVGVTLNYVLAMQYGIMELGLDTLLPDWHQAIT